MPTPEAQGFDRRTGGLGEGKLDERNGVLSGVSSSYAHPIGPQTLLNLSVPAPPISAPVLWDHYHLLQGSLGPCLQLPLPPIGYRANHQRPF